MWQIFSSNSVCSLFLINAMQHCIEIHQNTGYHLFTFRYWPLLYLLKGGILSSINIHIYQTERSNTVGYTINHILSQGSELNPKVKGGYFYFFVSRLITLFVICANLNKSTPCFARMPCFLSSYKAF